MSWRGSKGGCTCQTDRRATAGHRWAPFDWADPFHLGDQLGEDERMVAESARSFAGDRLAPRVTEAYLEEHVTPEIFAEMGKWAFWA
jgi:glutaryl-CoA dehydrogenase